MADHLPCPCGKSSDAFSVYEDTGWGTCFSGNCERNSPNWSPRAMEEADYDPGAQSPSNGRERAYVPPKDGAIDTIWDRKLSRETVKRYAVEVHDNGARTDWQLYDPNNEPHAVKTRRPGHKFTVEGSIKGAGLYGRHLFPPGSAKAITVTEGYEDALASFQMQGSKFPVVSVHSSATALADMRTDFEYLNSFETIVLCFDNDEAGKKAVKKVCEGLPFPIGKLKIIWLKRYKDSSDYLKNGHDAAYMKEWWQAEPYRPDGLVLGMDLWGEITREDKYFMVDWPWRGLNQKTYGLRTSELIILNAEQKIGKTSFVKHIEHKLLTDPVVIERGFGVGFLHFEEPKKDLGLGLISIENGVPYHLPDVAKPEQDLRAAFDKLLNNGRVVIYDHFGSNDIDVVLAKVRHMAAMGCKYIMIDHISIIVSDQSGDERKQLDEILTKLKTLTMELDICVVGVMHQNAAGGIRGTKAAEQLANIVIKLERDKMDPDPFRANVTRVSVTDNRFCGRCGIACHLFYDEDTTRFRELTQEESAAFEAGAKNGNDF